MKKIIFGLAILFVGSQLMVSCSSDSSVLSQFSKRKYLKKYKKEKVDAKGNIDTYEYAENTIENETIPEVEEYGFEEVATFDVSTINFDELNLDQEAEEILVAKNNNDKEYEVEESAIIDEVSEVVELNENVAQHQKINSKRVDDIVIILLDIFIPPLAVYLYEDSITTNFWVDLILTLFFWLPGIIFAFLVTFGGVSL